MPSRRHGKDCPHHGNNRSGRVAPDRVASGEGSCGSRAEQEGGAFCVVRGCVPSEPGVHGRFLSEMVLAYKTAFILMQAAAQIFLYSCDVIDHSIVFQLIR